LRDLVVSMIDETDLFEAIAFLALLVIGPASLFGKGLKMVRTRVSCLRDPRQGRLYLVGSALWASLSGWFFIDYGGALMRHLLNSFGPWVYGILIAIIVCVVALPLCFTGRQLRLTWNLRQQNQNRRRLRTPLLTGLIGLGLTAVVIAIVFMTQSVTLSIVAAGLAIGALAVGWFGGVLVPDLGLSD